MEAQEFGEMMEHVDEVNFALDGLRPGQPVRIRRASLLSLLSICGTAHQRRILRAQGMAKRIIDSVLDLSFDDSPSTTAAAALFYVLASDVQDDHLLNSPSCIRFLLKLLNPCTTKSGEDQPATIGSKFLGICKPNAINTVNKSLDSSSNAIVLKVHEILLSCKEIKSSNGDVVASRRPELNSKWISLLTMEKACLSTISFQDTSESIRRSVGNFKERLRELGGLDAIVDVVASCHSTMEGLFRHKRPTISESNSGVALESVVLLLKCLKIMENATFLSKNNQDYLLDMKRRLPPIQPEVSFVAMIIKAIRLLSALSLIQSSPLVMHDGKSNCLSGGTDAYAREAYEPQLVNNKGEKSHVKRSNDVARARQKKSNSQTEPSISDSDVTVASASDSYSMKEKISYPSHACNGALSGYNSKYTKDSLSCTNGMNSSKAYSSRKQRGGSCKKRLLSDILSNEHMNDDFDPYAFDEDESKPTKWELAIRKESPQKQHNSITSNEDMSDCLPVITNVDRISQSTNAESHQSYESSCPSTAEDSTILEDCLLTAVKVLMNLTNDNPIGCLQIAACDGLDTMMSLIIKHFPAYESCSDMKLKNKTSSNLNVKDDNRNDKHLSDHKLDFLVAILGLLVNLVEKDSRNRSRLISASIAMDLPGSLESKQGHKDVIPLLCSIFLANKGAGEVAGEGRLLSCDDEVSLLEGEQEAEMMIVEAYSALLLAFLSTESFKAREAIASHLPDQNLRVLVPVLERFVAFHLTLNMISPETHSAVSKVIESCKAS